MPNFHEYPVTLEWAGGREGHGAAVAENSGTTFALAVPAEYQGTGEGTNPEELLTTAIAACYSITFGIIAANRKLPVAEFDVSATGVVEQNGLNLVYKSITVRPVVTLEASASDEQVSAAEELAHKADGYCIITNAVRGKVEVTVEPTVVRG
ncbi:MAG TPA: OsmC family protein [Fimbriimonadaceae bacterium]|nr:OsmC family protein [Fimbriimonadaceae bacterium]